MDRKTAENFISDLYWHLLKRYPREKEFEDWVLTACARPSEEVFDAFVNCDEYKSKNHVLPFYDSGHYYSPVVDPSTVRAYVQNRRSVKPHEILGISLDLDTMVRFFEKLSPFIMTTKFEAERGASEIYRYYYENGNFSYGDAIILRAMIHFCRPSKIIEIGSGFSSACIIDAAEDGNLRELSLVCIDPYADRLRSLLRSHDHSNVRIIERPVQEVELEVFSSLGVGDILFIDSTHVLKTGSDVHYELFSIMPMLAAGVMIHFHDVHYPFEYPDNWIFDDNYSWNEVYALRAFLMYNTQFRVAYWNSLLATVAPDILMRTHPLLMKNPGGSIWLFKDQ